MKTFDFVVSISNDLGTALSEIKKAANESYPGESWRLTSINVSNGMVKNVQYPNGVMVYNVVAVVEQDKETVLSMPGID